MRDFSKNWFIHYRFVYNKVESTFWKGGFSYQQFNHIQLLNRPGVTKDVMKKPQINAIFDINSQPKYLQYLLCGAGLVQALLQREAASASAGNMAD